MVEQVLLEIRAMAGEARRELAALARDLVTFDSINAEAEASVDIKKGIAQLDLLKAALERVDKKSITANAQVRISEALTEIAALKAALAEADKKGLSLNVREDIKTRIAGLSTEVDKLVKSLNASRAGSSELRSELFQLSRSLPNLDFKIIGNVDTAAAHAQLNLFEREIGSIDRKHVSVDVDLKITQALFQIQLLRERLRQAEERGLTVNLKGSILSDIRTLEGSVVSLVRDLRLVEEPATGLSRLFSLGGKSNATSQAFAAISKNIGDVVRQFPVVGTLVSEIGQSILSLGNKSGTAFAQIGASVIAAGVAIVGFVEIIHLLITVISALIAVLSGLVASLAAAAAGAATLGVGLLGALGPAALLLIVLFSRLQKVMQAHQQQQLALKSAVDQRNQADLQSIQNAERIRSSNQSVQSAIDAVREAHQNLRQAVVDGQQAMIDSALALKDAILGVRDAELGIAESRLSFREAKQQLKDFRDQLHLTGVDLTDIFKRATDVSFNPTKLRNLLRNVQTTTGQGLTGDQQLQLERLVLNVRRAKLGEQQATNSLANAENNLNKARKTQNDFLQKGLRAYGPYVSAVKQLNASEKNLNEALHQRQVTNQELLIQQQQQTAAQAQYLDKQTKLTAEEKQFLKNINDLLSALSKLTKAFTDPIFAALNRIFSGLGSSIALITPVMTNLGKAFADFVTSFGKFIKEPQTIAAFGVMADGAARLVRSLGAKAFVDFLRIMRNIAVAVMPDLISKGNSIARTFSHLAQSTSDIGKLRKNIQPLITAFNTWWDIVKLLAIDFIKFVRDAQGPAQRIANAIRQWLINLGKFLDSKKGREEVRQWIEHGVKVATEFWHALKDIVHWANVLGNTFNDVFGPIIKGLGVVLTIINKIHDALDKLTKRLGPFGSALKLALSPLSVGSKVISGAGKLLGSLNPFQSGGPTGAGGIVLTHPNEYIVRSAIVSQLGMPFFDNLNRGGLTGAISGAGGRTGGISKVINIENVNIDAPGNEYPDARHAVAALTQELRSLGA